MKKRIGVTLLTLCMLLGLLPTMALAAEDNTSTASVDWNYGIAEVSSWDQLAAARDPSFLDMDTTSFQNILNGRDAVEKSTFSINKKRLQHVYQTAVAAFPRTNVEMRPYHCESSNLLCLSKSPDLRITGTQPSREIPNG